MGSFTDLTGKKFNRLTVLSLRGKKGKAYYWNCKCDCGVEKVFRGSSLVHDEIKSCGCLKIEKAKEKAADLTGKRFGRLTVVGKVPHKRRESYWRCVCDCGGETTASTYSLQSGHTTSCGCYNREVSAEIGRSTKKYNDYWIEGNTVYVVLNSDSTMLCDKEDWERFKELKWNVGGMGYACARDLEKKKTVRFHRELMGRKEGLVIDHINRNKLDNRKCNLRFITQRANVINREPQTNSKSGVPGVKFHHGKWQAAVWVKRKMIVVGRYENKVDAIKAREEAEKKYYDPLFEVD